MNQGSSNRGKYDLCNYNLALRESTDPLAYRLYLGAQESCNKCVYDKFYVKYQPEIVDVESDLKNITRPLSSCPQYMYSPTCRTSASCISTFSKSAPVILAPEVCPIVHNNIPRQTNPGYRLPNPDFCRRR